MYGHGKSRLSHAEKTAYPVGRYVILGGAVQRAALYRMSAFPGVSSYQSSSLGSKFVVIGVVCCQEMRRNALFHKVLPVLTKYFD
jgi:hypothetical protein